MLNDATGFDKIFIATGYTDLRRGIDGLASTIKYQFELDPFQKNTCFFSVANVPTESKDWFGKEMGFCFFTND